MVDFNTVKNEHLLLAVALFCSRFRAKKWGKVYKAPRGKDTHAYLMKHDDGFYERNYMFFSNTKTYRTRHALRALPNVSNLTCYSYDSCIEVLQAWHAGYQPRLTSYEKPAKAIHAAHPGYFESLLREAQKNTLLERYQERSKKLREEKLIWDCQGLRPSEIRKAFARLVMDQVPQLGIVFRKSNHKDNMFGCIKQQVELILGTFHNFSPSTVLKLMVENFNFDSDTILNSFMTHKSREVRKFAIHAGGQKQALAGLLDEDDEVRRCARVARSTGLSSEWRGHGL